MPNPMPDLIIDPARLSLGSTGIFVRAKHEGEWAAFDIITLERASLDAWLRSRGGENLWAENVVARLLGHP